ncbi:MAG: AraC family transcriptional regulator [Sphingomonadales bacterium]|nr:AraC family transcriptional regulator [Sphingomonadales bacterium]
MPSEVNPSLTPASEVFDVVHARILHFFPELVAELGGDAPGLLRRAGIAAESRPSGTYRQMIHLLELAAAELDCPDFGMRLAKRQCGAEMYGPLGLAMRNSRTFGHALTYVSKHTYAHSLAARIRLTHLPEGSAFSAHDILLDGVPVKTQLIEQIILVGHLAAMEMTGGHARVRRVHFRHQPVSPPGTYRRYFGCEVRFGQNEDGVLFAAGDLAAPVIDPDAQMFERLAAFIDSAFPRHLPPLYAQVRGVITQYLGSERCTNEHVAGELHLHPRTLHRRLRAEGTSFQKIKDEVRRDVMLYYLQQTRLDFTRISERLGFAEQSVMTRSCNRWFAASPTRVRLGAAKGVPNHA